MRKPPPASGFFLCFAWNLLFDAGWAGLAFVLWLLRLWLHVIPLFIPLALLGVWLLAALLHTLFFSWVSKAGSAPETPSVNKNPYSATNAQVFAAPEAPQVSILDALMEEDTIFYFSRKSTCEDMACNLSALAVLHGLPPIPEGLLELHPMQADPHAPQGHSEMLGGMAAVYIAEKVSAWRVVLIDDGSGSGYAGAVPHEHAEGFAAALRKAFANTGSMYSVELL